MKSFYRERRHVCGKTIASAKYQEVDIYPMTGTDASRAYDKETAAPRRLPTRKAPSRTSTTETPAAILCNWSLRILTSTICTLRSPTAPVKSRRPRQRLAETVTISFAVLPPPTKRRAGRR